MTASRSLGGPGWQVKGFLGVDGAELAARRGWDEGRGWLAATVPGSVVADLWRAGEVPDPFVERNSLAIEWVPERTWLYRRRFEAGPAHGERAWLRFDGVDHAAQVWLDGELLGRHEGMFTPFEWDVTERLRGGGEHVLAVVVEPAPISEPQTGRTSRVRVHKSRMTYGWDFCPRMIHQGIWQGVRLEVAGTVRITDAWARPTLTDDGARASVAIAIELDLADAASVDLLASIDGLPGIEATVADRLDLPGGRSTATIDLDVTNPPLWWPNGHGPAPVGRLAIRAAANGDEATTTVPIAFRRVRLVPNEGAVDSARPYTFEVNGRRIYAKGWNWVPHDVFHGVEPPERIEHLTRLLADAGVNLVRVWGGGLIETPAFYDACDRLGIMVWQEFIQSSSGIEDRPSDDPGWVELMTREAEAIVPLRRNHGSLVLWCGGNELQDEAGPLDDERSPVLAALGRTVHALDPDRAWLPTSPTGPVFHNRLDVIESRPDDLHDVHGPWEHQGLVGQYELANGGTSLLSSEFGVEGMTNRRVHEALIAPERRLPADRSNAVYRHLGDWWNNDELVRASFGGRIDELETLRRASQHLQADGLRYAIEANRRRWPRNSGSLPWQFNEPYPMAWCTSAVDHRGDPKPAYHAVRRAYLPVTVTARFAGVALDGARGFEAEIWAGSEVEALARGHVSAALVTPDGRRIAEDTWDVDLPDDRPRAVGRLAASFEDRPPELLLLDLRLTDDAGTERAANRYTFSGTADLAPLLELPAATIEVETTPKDDDRWMLRLRHAGGPAALGLVVTDGRPLETPGWAEADDGWFDLLPGEERIVRVTWAEAPATPRRVIIGGWNVAPIEHG